MVTLAISANAAIAASPNGGQTREPQATVPAPQRPGVAPASAAQQVQARNALNKLPMHFEAHAGEPGGAKYHARGRGYHLSLHGQGMVLKLKKPEAMPSDPQARRDWLRAHVKGDKQQKVSRTAGGSTAVLGKSFPGANANLQVVGEDLLPGKSHYLVGKDSTRWRRNIPNYAKVRYRNVYPGIDLVYYGNQGRIEYDWVVAPGADPHRIVESFNGATDLQIAANGDLLVVTADGPIVQKKPVVYQEAATRRLAVEASYVLIGDKKVAFKIGQYDRSLPLIIDPIVEYSTYLGGAYADSATSVAVNAAGELFVAGVTQSPDFPHNPGDILPTGPFGEPVPVAFVTKLNATGDAILYSTYFGGAGFQNGTDGSITSGVSLALGADGSAYVAGIANTANFPATTFLQAPGQPSASVQGSAFVVKLTPSGNAMSYATLVARQGFDTQSLNVSLAVDASGSAYIAGTTSGLVYPTTAGTLQPNKLVETRYDGFLAKLTPSGNALAYSTLFGSVDAGDTTGNTFVKGLAIDASGNAYIMGETFAPGIPLVNAHQPTGPGFFPNASFYAKFNSSGTALDYSSFYDYFNVRGITIDRQGNTLLAGGVVSKVNGNGGIDFHLGLSGGIANAIATDRLGNIYVTGVFETNAYQFQPVGAAGLGGDPQFDRFDAFVTKIAADGSAVGFSMLLGGDALGPDPSQFNNSDFTGGLDAGTGIAVDINGGVYVVGITRSPNFPILNPVRSVPEGQVLSTDPNATGFIYSEAFVTKLTEPLGGVGLFSSQNPSYSGDSITLTAIIGDNAATGTVTYFDGAATVGTAPVTNGVARLTVSTLSIATHSLTARYNGDATHPAATSAPLIQEVLDPNVQPADTVTTFTAVANPDGSLTYNATVSGNNPTGIVTFIDNGMRWVRNVSAGAASVTIPNPLPGPHTVVARYSGDARNKPSDSGALNFRAGPPEVVITAPQNGATFQYPASISFTVDAFASLGTTITSVTLLVDGATVATLTAPPYTFAYANGPPGTHTLSARATDSTGRTSALASVQIRFYEPVTYYHHDLQGNVIAASDGLGVIQYNESYLPYGDRRIGNPASAVGQTNGNRLWFHGKAQDEATGLQYFGARYYDPVLGRFMGVDPQGFDEKNLHSVNRYAYGNNNPLKFQDPDGHLPFLIIPAISYAASLTSAAITGYQVGTVINNVATGQQTAADAVKEAAPGIAISVAFGVAGKVAAGTVKVGKAADSVVDASKGLTPPSKYFGSKSKEEVTAELTKKFGPPKSSREAADTFYNERTKRSFNVHQEKGHMDGKPHVDIRRRGGYEERKYTLEGE